MKRWSHLFVGREDELRVLRTAFAEASLGFPKVVAVVAESGFGKTRLVQEFYGWLSTHHDGVGGAGYWPDKLLRQENNLIVNPDAASCGNGVAMPFLWWALRMPDPGARNEILVGAMWPAVEQLKPHLLAQAKLSQLANLGKSAWTEVAKGAGDIATDVAGNLLSFGLLGIGKAVLQTGKALYDLKQQGDELRGVDASPSLVRAKADDELTTTILADLYRLAIKPPESVAPIPLVVVVDDAQWLSKDPGCRVFVRSLVDRARREGWPLLVILTTWEREWLESRRRKEDPGDLVDLARGDRIIELGRAPRLEDLLVDAFPGLLLEQRGVLIDMVDGNPRFLDELLQYLDRNPKLFVGRDQRLPLTPKGFADAKGRDFAELVADRYATTPEEVRRALGISSLQGVAFSPRLAHSMAARLSLPDPLPAIALGDDPHAFISFDEQGLGAEFRQRAYQKVATEDVGNHFSEEQAAVALVAALEQVPADLEKASNFELSLVLERGSAASAIASAAELIRRAVARHDPRSAGKIAIQAIPLLQQQDVEGDSLFAIIDAYWDWKGPNPDVGNTLRRAFERRKGSEERDSKAQLEYLEILSRFGTFYEELEGPASAKAWRLEEETLSRALATELGTPEARRRLADAVWRLGNVVEALEGPAAAKIWRVECEALSRALATELDTPEARRDLAVAVSQLGNVVEALKGPAAAKGWWVECEALLRALATELGTPQARRELAVAVSRLGSVVEALEGPAAVKIWRVECEALSRALATELGTPEARRELAIAVSRLGDVVEALEGPAAAKAWRLECEVLLRALATELGTPQARRDLANAVSRLGSVVEALEGPAAAKAWRLEEEALSRALATELGTPEARRELAIAVSGLGDVVEALEGPAAAKAWRLECEALLRALATELGTPQARRDLAKAVSRLGNAVEALEGAAAAKAWRLEEEALSRALATELGTPEARRDLAVAVSRLGNVVEALEGPAAAKGRWVECEALLRALATELGTPQARRDLANSVSRLGNVVEALEGPAAAKIWRLEEEALSRALATELGTPEARHGLALAVLRLGDVVQVLEGPAAAKAWRIECEALSRALATELGTPEARRGFALAVSRLGIVVEALEGPAAAKAWWTECEALLRVLATELDTPQARHELTLVVQWLASR